MRLRIATFNVENLASRNVYGPKARPMTAPALSLFDFAEPQTKAGAEAAAAIALEDDKRALTALAIAETRADILALQEVDNLGVLAPFLANYVHAVSDIRYGHTRLIDGNDPRGIDVAFAARKDLVADDKAVRARSYHEATFGELDVYDAELEQFGIGRDDLVFNRDCLEVALDLGDRSLTLFICHLKSIGMGVKGRATTRVLRACEARAVRHIVENRFGARWREANWIVAGDLNDFVNRILPGGEIEKTGPSGIDCLTADFAVDPAVRLPPLERWTYYHRDRDRDGEGGGFVEQHVQLDYLLLSPALAAANPEAKLEIIRRGLPYRVPLDPAHPDRSIARLSTRADRYPLTGWDRPNASDHCPVVIEIDLPAIRL